MTLPAQMTVIEITSPGGPDVLKAASRPLPELRAGEVLIKVAAAGVNRPDVMQRAGSYAPPPGASDLPGLEVAGTIVATAGDCGVWKIGDAVMALTPGGGYAEYCATPAPHCLRLPKGYDFVQGAAIPENYFTVWTNVFDRARLKSGESFLVHGGSSGIGTTAIQLAHHFGARVFTTAGSKEKCDTCRTLGADVAINYRDQDFVDAIMQATDRAGIDVILDMVGGDYINRNLKVLALDGRLVQIAFLQGNTAEINLAQIMVKRQTITGSTLRPRTVADKAAIANALAEKVLPLLDAGAIKPIIHKTFPLREAAAAHQLMETSTHTGKIMLAV
ncbi:MAG TPA: NAD(P)H-quinone oxidoreductase [Terriglobales bacterium]|nr:NAD(P)H-quinone oxidoreductase [Terriglobales bacterium]